jgi:hypothetical protein
MKICSEFVLGLALTLPVTVSAHAPSRPAGPVPTARRDVAAARLASAFTEGLQTDRRPGELSQIAGKSQAANHQRLTRFATEIDGDHSLDAATIAEKTFDRFVLYTVRLEFASGREQSIAVTAPPGGLQPEMHDMSGDNIANDVVLTSKLLRSPLVVLLNDGHDHLTVAVSPGSFASREDQAAGGHSAHRASMLVPQGFRLIGPGNARKLIHCGSRERVALSCAPRLTERADYASDFGRAPPARSPQS